MLIDAPIIPYLGIRIKFRIMFIPMIITGSIFPVIITLRDLDKKLYFKKLQMVYDIFTWFSIGIAIVITFLSNSVISLLYGPNYMGASTVLSIQIWAGVFVFFGVVSARYFVIENLTKISFHIKDAGERN